MIYIYDGGSLSVTEEEEKKKKDFYSSSIRLGCKKHIAHSPPSIHGNKSSLEIQKFLFKMHLIISHGECTMFSIASNIFLLYILSFQDLYSSICITLSLYFSFKLSFCCLIYKLKVK